MNDYRRSQASTPSSRRKRIRHRTIHPLVAITCCLFAPETFAQTEVEPNDNLNAAMHLGDIPAVESAELECVLGNSPALTHDVDFYSVTAPNGSDFPIMLAWELSADWDSHLRLFNAAGIEIARSDKATDGDGLRFGISEPGTYYLGVSTARNNAFDPLNIVDLNAPAVPEQSYQLDLTTYAIDLPTGQYEPNHEQNDATLLADASQTVVGEWIGDGAHGHRDVDIFRVPLAGPADVRVSAESVDQLLDPAVRVWYGLLPITQNDDASLDSNDAAVAFGVPFATDIYIGISSADNLGYDPIDDGSGTPGSTGAYTLELEINYFDGAGEDEPNDSILTATDAPTLISAPYRPDTYYWSGHVGDGPYGETRGDRDFYAIRLGGETDLVEISVDPAAGSELVPLIALFDPTGTRIATASSPGPGLPARITMPTSCIVPISEFDVVGYLLVGGVEQRIWNDPLLPHPLFHSRQKFYTGGAGSTGAYEVTASVAAEPAPCPSGESETEELHYATGLTDQGTFFCVDGELGNSPCGQPATDIDVFTFTVSQPPARVEIGVLANRCLPLESLTSENAIYLFDSSRKVIAYTTVDNQWQQEALSARLEHAGTYYAAIGTIQQVPDIFGNPCTNYYTPEGQYALSIKLDPVPPDVPNAVATTGSTSGGIAGADETSVITATRDLGMNMLDIRADNFLPYGAVPLPQRSSFQEGIAYDGESIFYHAGGWYPSLMQFDRQTLQLIGQTNLWMGSGLYGDMTWLGGKLYLTDYAEQTVHVIDATTNTHERTFNIGNPAWVRIGTAIASLAGPNRLFLNSVHESQTLLEVDAASGAVTAEHQVDDHPVTLAGQENNRLYTWTLNEPYLQLQDRMGQTEITVFNVLSVNAAGAMPSFGPFADFDADGDLDLADLADFMMCFLEDGPLPPYCERGDGTGDQFVDLVDFNAIPDRLTGP